MDWEATLRAVRAFVGDEVVVDVYRDQAALAKGLPIARARSVLAKVGEVNRAPALNPLPEEVLLTFEPAATAEIGEPAPNLILYLRAGDVGLEPDEPSSAEIGEPPDGRVRLFFGGDNPGPVVEIRKT
jgi:hypothetical protein